MPQHRIEHFERIYRVAEPAAQRVLESIAQGSLLAEYETALDRVIADPEEVILIKHVHLRCFSRLSEAEPFRLAKRWGEEMARAVDKAVRMAGDHRGIDVVRFPNEAAHAAAFLLEVVNHKDPRVWYFARFAGFLRPSPAKTLEAFFEASAKSSGPVLRQLSEMGEISAVLKLLDHRTAARLWKRLSRAGEPIDPQATRPLFAAAVTLLERTQSISLTQARTAKLWEEFKTSRQFRLDWRDPALLADQFVEIIGFLAECLRLPPPAWNEVFAAELRNFDWIDRERVKQRLGAVSDPASDFAGARRRIRQTPRPGPTPRQRAWQRVLQSVLDEVDGELSQPINSPVNRLLILAGMIRREPGWENDAGLSAWIEQVLANRRLSDFSGATEFQSSPMEAEKLRQQAPQLAGQNAVWSQAAGSLLLWRGISDLGAAALARRCAFPLPGNLGTRWLIAALLAKCAGVPVNEDDGLRLLAGIERPVDETQFLDTWQAGSSAVEDFQCGLLQLALGHRLVAADKVRVAMMPQTEGYLLLAGDADARIWPHSAFVSTFEVAAERVQAWSNAWSEIFSPPPALQVPPAMTALLAHLSPQTAGGLPETLPSDLESLAGASVGLPVADATLTQFAALVLRAWARWLRGFADASPAYLLNQFIRRPGWISVEGNALRVELESAPLDVVLEMAGYFDPLELLSTPEAAAQLPYERLEFHVTENAR